jgi:hypothetical protein
MCARRRSHLSLLRQRNVTQRKASRSRRHTAWERERTASPASRASRRRRESPSSRPRRDVAHSATDPDPDPDPRGPPLYAPRSTALGGSGLALSERSEFSQTPTKASTAGSRSASGGRRQWGRLSFGDFSFAQKKSYCAAGRTTRPGMPETLNTSLKRPRHH